MYKYAKHFLGDLWKGGPYIIQYIATGRQNMSTFAVIYTEMMGKQAPTLHGGIHLCCHLISKRSLDGPVSCKKIAGSVGNRLKSSYKSIHGMIQIYGSDQQETHTFSAR